LAVVATVKPIQAEVEVIANPSVAADSISKADLKKIFLGEKSGLGGGSKVVPVLLRQGSDHAEFVSKYLGESPVSLLLAWRGLVMSGEATMPKSFDTDAEVVEYVTSTPGAIGYIDSKTPHKTAKVLEVH
jgi:ABC-type phosphate transport system substrate-binding protein